MLNYSAHKRSSVYMPYFEGVLFVFSKVPSSVILGHDTWNSRVNTTCKVPFHWIVNYKLTCRGETELAGLVALLE